MTESVYFSQSLPLGCKDPLERQIYFLADEIQGFELIVGPQGIDGVKIDVDDAAGLRPADIGNRIRAAEDAFSRRKPAKRPDRIWSHSTGRVCAARTFERMEDEGLAFRIGPGLVGVGQLVLGLMDVLDRRITSMVKRVFGAVEYRYPTLISTEVMKRGGYLRSFPHFLMFVTRVHSDFDTYRRVMAEEDGGGGFPLQSCCSTDLCLPPTICYHTYSQYRGTVLPPEGRVVTARGKSFRFESRYERNLERLWDFTIREIVFLGTHRNVSGQRQKLMLESFALIEELGLNGYCETANDPFFVEDEEKNSSLLQRMLALKYELRLEIDGGNTLAAASFNLHNDFFAKMFDITEGHGEPARTSCAGFGLERLSFAFLCQHGLDPAAWPAGIGEAVRESIV
jgi:hypothetical protein